METRQHELESTPDNGDRPVVRPFGAPPPAVGWPRSAVITAVALGALVGVALVGVGFLLGSGLLRDDAPEAVSQQEDADAAAQGPEEPAAAPSEADVQPAASPADGAGGESRLANDQPDADAADPAASPSAEKPPAPREDAPRTAAAQVAGDPARTAVYRDGKVYLGGMVPSQEVADELAAKVGTVVGPENVVTEYVIDPSAPLSAATPLYVDDTVLFAYGSAEIRAPFMPLLELGVTLLDNFPQSSMTVIGHTDAAGSAEFNLALSQRRVDAVVGYLRGRGIAPDRVRGEARGEGEPIADNATAEGAAANRRAEFVVHDLLES